MSTQIKPKHIKHINILLGIVILMSIAGWVWWIFNGASVVSKAFHGQFHPAVDKFIEIHRSIAPDERDLGYFLDKALPVAPRLFGSLAGLCLLLMYLLNRQYARIQAYFDAKTHPVNLALYRVVIFASLLIYTDAATISRFAEIPDVLRAPPPGWQSVITLLPFDPSTVSALTAVFMVSVFLAMLGVYTRIFGCVAVLLGIWTLGIPQFYGKINHYHHLLWFAAVVALSPSDVVLSVRALLTDTAQKYPFRASRIYALPIRIIWLLMGVIYFFPGWWKWIIGGTDWAFSNNLQYLIYTRWYQLDWLPSLRIDAFPALLHLSGAGVILFEISFIFLLFFPLLRRYLPIAGLLFHMANFLILRINFWTLAVSYITFWDAEKQFTAFREKLFRYLPRTPPLLRFFAISDLPTQATQRLRGELRLIQRTGAVLLTVNLTFGFVHLDSWPFAVYPSFATLEEPYTQTIFFEVVTTDGEVHTTSLWERKTLARYIRPPRLTGFVWQIHWCKDEGLKKARAAALIALLRKYDPLLAKAQSINIVAAISRVQPAAWHEPPLRRDLLYRWEKAAEYHSP